MIYLFFSSSSFVRDKARELNGGTDLFTNIKEKRVILRTREKESELERERKTMIAIVTANEEMLIDACELDLMTIIRVNRE